MQRNREAETRNHELKKNSLTIKNEINDAPFFFLSRRHICDHSRILAASGYTRTPSIGSLSRNHASGPGKIVSLIGLCSPATTFPARLTLDTKGRRSHIILWTFQTMSIDSARQLIFHSLLLTDLPFSCIFPDNLFSQCTAHRSNCAIPSVKCKLLNFESVMMHILVSSHLDVFAPHQLPSFAFLPRLLPFHVPKSYLPFYLFFSRLLYSKLLNKHLSRSRANRRLVFIFHQAS